MGDNCGRCGRLKCSCDQHQFPGGCQEGDEMGRETIFLVRYGEGSVVIHISMYTVSFLKSLFIINTDHLSAVYSLFKVFSLNLVLLTVFQVTNSCPSCPGYGDIDVSIPLWNNVTGKIIQSNHMHHPFNERFYSQKEPILEILGLVRSVFHTPVIL